MEPPEIRISRFEQSLAIRWADDENWYRFEPEQMILTPEGDRHRVGPGPGEWPPDAEWIDPFEDPRPDIRRWTDPIRRQLRHAEQLLDSAERHPWSG